jgi:hypothetical protein
MEDIIDEEIMDRVGEALVVSIPGPVAAGILGM